MTMVSRLGHAKQQPPQQQCMNTIDKQRMLRTPEYGYAHVWELQQLQGEEHVHLPGSGGLGGGLKHVEGVPCIAGQTRLGDHKYESPQFLRIDNTTLGRVQCQYPEFHHDLEPQLRMTECEAHPNIVQCTGEDQRYTN
jgi:hypothetical protein